MNNNMKVHTNISQESQDGPITGHEVRKQSLTLLSFPQIVTIQMSLLSIFIIERKQDLTYFLKFCISMNSIIWLNFLYKFFRMTKHIKLYVKIKNIFSFRLALALKMDGKIAYLLCSTNATTIPVNQVPLLILF